ncbi:glycine oxidase ThiO [Salisaeta longa]|uniref:glycine oxidase ThiO n=1 Tax=Salisaeta longa TaxID=503170 RepID=UPI0003B71229|nr:glycine oxidase ThiO [Salisaeta longa]
MAAPSVGIVGGGAIGLATGWVLAQRGAHVTVWERGRAGRGTSWWAAGMLAPDAELQFEELELYALNRESLRRWPDFARDLEAASGQSVDYRDEGTLLVADDHDAAEQLRRLYAFQREHELAVEWLDGSQAREIEPFVAPRLSAAVWVPSDHQVDNRKLVQALRAAFVDAGGTLHEDAPVTAVQPDGNEPAIVPTEGTRTAYDTVIVAAGVWSREVEGLVPAPPIRPVKGQSLQLRMALPFDMQHVVRGPEAYLAPKSDGRLVVGATSEEMGFDTRVTAGGIYDVLEGAWEVVPGIRELEVEETWAGLRPASRDHAPLLGRAAPGVVYATGHYRHGILLTPVTAQEVARLVLAGETSEWIEPFAPTRFSSATASSP